MARQARPGRACGAARIPSRQPLSLTVRKQAVVPTCQNAALAPTRKTSACALPIVRKSAAARPTHNANEQEPEAVAIARALLWTLLDSVSEGFRTSTVCDTAPLPVSQVPRLATFHIGRLSMRAKARAVATASYPLLQSPTGDQTRQRATGQGREARCRPTDQPSVRKARTPGTDSQSQPICRHII